MCEKCRLRELFDEELARFATYDNDEAFSIARHRYALERHGESQQRAKVIAEREPFREQPDPLAEWKALEPGRKVLEIETKDILRVGNKDRDGLFLQRSNYHELDMFTWEKLSKGYQIIHEGPFDASKLKVGDWVWVECSKSLDKEDVDLYGGWATVAFFNHKDKPIIVNTNGGPVHFYNNGNHMYGSDLRLHFSPPTPPSKDPKMRELENAYIEQGAILEWIQRILDGIEVSDFALSYPIVRQVWDLKQEASHD